MKATLRKLWPFGRLYEIRMLNRDSRYIVEDALGRFPEDRVVHMANTTRAYLAEATEQLALPQIERENVLLHFQNLHRNARREQRDMALSALTLVLIHLRAQAHGDACTAAVEVIAEFVQEWGSDDESDAPTGQAGRLQA